MHRLVIVLLLLVAPTSLPAAGYEGEGIELQLPDEGWQWRAPADDGVPLRGVREADGAVVELRVPEISERVGLSRQWIESVVQGFKLDGWEVQAQNQGRIEGAAFVDLVMTGQQPSPRSQWVRLLPANGRLYRLSATLDRPWPEQTPQIEALFDSWSFTAPPSPHEIASESGWGKALGIAMLVVLLGAIYQFVHLRRVRLGRDPRRSRYDPPLKR